MRKLNAQQRREYETRLSKAIAHQDAEALEALFASPEGSASVQADAHEMIDGQRPETPRQALFFAALAVLLLKRRLTVEQACRANLEALVKSLSQRVAGLEARHALEYRGVWEAKDYPVGSFVTRG